MLDNILSNLKKGAERARVKGEEVAHAARLRVEVFQLGRELDGLYGRLGRSYHSGAELGVLQGVQDEIRRVEEEISARERLITELGGDPSTLLTDDPVPAPPSTAPHSASAPAQAAPTAQTPWPASPASATSTPAPRAPTTGAGQPDPTVPHSDQKLPVGDTAAPGGSQGDLGARDTVQHQNNLGQAATMRGHGDPLDK